MPARARRAAERNTEAVEPTAGVRGRARSKCSANKRRGVDAALRVDGWLFSIDVDARSALNPFAEVQHDYGEFGAPPPPAAAAAFDAAAAAVAAAAFAAAVKGASPPVGAHVPSSPSSSPSASLSNACSRGKKWGRSVGAQRAAGARSASWRAPQQTAQRGSRKLAWRGAAGCSRAKKSAWARIGPSRLSGRGARSRRHFLRARPPQKCGAGAL